MWTENGGNDFCGKADWRVLGNSEEYLASDLSLQLKTLSKAELISPQVKQSLKNSKFSKVTLAGVWSPSVATAVFEKLLATLNMFLVWRMWRSSLKHSLSPATSLPYLVCNANCTKISSQLLSTAKVHPVGVNFPHICTNLFDICRKSTTTGCTSALLNYLITDLLADGTDYHITNDYSQPGLGADLVFLAGVWKSARRFSIPRNRQHLAASNCK